MHADTGKISKSISLVLGHGLYFPRVAARVDIKIAAPISSPLQFNSEVSTEVWIFEAVVLL